MARRQRDDLRAAAIEESIVPDDERSNSALNKACKGSLKVAFAAGVHDIDLPPERARCLLGVSRLSLGIEIRVHEHADHGGVRN